MDPSRKGGTMMIWTLLEKEEQVEDINSVQKEETGQRYTLSSERKNKSKTWTIFGKEEQVEDMDSPRKGRIG